MTERIEQYLKSLDELVETKEEDEVYNLFTNMKNLYQDMTKQEQDELNRILYKINEKFYEKSF